MFFKCVFIITDKTKDRRGGGRRCRCHERRSEKLFESLKRYLGCHIHVNTLVSKRIQSEGGGYR